MFSERYKKIKTGPRCTLIFGFLPAFVYKTGNELNYEILAAFVLATALLSVSPGPDNIYVLTQSIARGKKYGLATTAGLMTGCLVHTTLLALGISTLIKNYPFIFMAIKVFGAIYLFYLAYRVYRSSPVIRMDEEISPKKGLWNLYRQGFIMNVLNPKVTIFFLAFFPGFLFSDTIDTVWQFYILGALFILVSFLIFAGIAVLSGTISDYIRYRPGVGTWLKWMQIAVFTGIGIYLLISQK